MTPKLSQLWVDTNAYATNLLIAYLDTYGMDGLDWTPETIEMELRQDFNVEITPINFQKLMTAINILTTNSFFVSPTDFATDCVTLSGVFLPDNLMVLPDSEDIAWGITEAMLIAPPDESEQEPFSREVLGFIDGVLNEEGMLSPPDVLRIATGGRRIDQVSADFSDDPTMFAAIHQMETDKAEEVNRVIKTKMIELLQQLQNLPLKHGKTGIVEKMLARLSGLSAGK